MLNESTLTDVRGSLAIVYDHYEIRSETGLTGLGSLTNSVDVG